LQSYLQLGKILMYFFDTFTVEKTPTVLRSPNISYVTLQKDLVIIYWTKILVEIQFTTKKS
jgi:hypothetical protein